MITAASMTFGGLTIRYDERILRPRPWTEEQARWAAELADGLPGDVLELCTGAGHIGLLLAALSGRRVVAVDVDPVAGDFALRNAVAAGLSGRFEVRVGALETALWPEERFGLVVADPPWVPRGETARFPDDPVLAIDGGHDVQAVARLCLAVAARHVRPGGAVLLQLGTETQADALELPRGLERRELRTCPGGVLLHLASVPAVGG